MQVWCKVSPLVFLLVLSTAEAKSVRSEDGLQQAIVQNSESDGEIIMTPVRDDGERPSPSPKRIIDDEDDDGDLIPMPKSIDEDSEPSARQLSLSTISITKVSLALKTGIPVALSFVYNKIKTGKRWLVSAPLSNTLQLTCTIALSSSTSCSAGLFQLSAGTQTLNYCGLFGTYRWTVSINKMEILAAKWVGVNTGKFNCSLVALANTTSTSTSATTTAVTTTTTTTTGTTSTTTSPPANPTCKCGRKNPIVRIVGGVATTVNEYPWQVGLVSPTGTTPFCGGSIISDQYIVTAAHCVNGDSPSSLRVVIGEHNTLSTTETTATKYINAQSITIHPSYNSNTQNNDIAIIKLATPITFPTDNKVAPICLPPAGPTYEGVQATVTGWGTTSEGGSLSSVLQEVTIPILTNSRCSTLLGTSFISSSMICAGPETGGKDSCQGDSGGPFTTSGGTNYEVLVGIVSWGYGCARPGLPGVYTRVNSYLSWINTIIAGSTTCPAP